MTKSDAVVPIDLAKRATLLKRELEKDFRGANLDILIVSARASLQLNLNKSAPSGSGISQLRSHLLGLVAAENAAAAAAASSKS